MWPKTFAALLLFSACQASELYEVEEIIGDFDEAGRRLQPSGLISEPLGSWGQRSLPVERNNWSLFGNRCRGNVEVYFSNPANAAYDDATRVVRCGTGQHLTIAQQFGYQDGSTLADPLNANWNTIVASDTALAPRIHWRGAIAARTIPNPAGAAPPAVNVNQRYTIAIMDPDAQYGTGNGRPAGFRASAPLNNVVQASAIDVDVPGAVLLQRNLGAAGNPGCIGDGVAGNCPAFAPGPLTQLGYQIGSGNVVLPFLALSPPGIAPPVGGPANPLQAGRFRAAHRFQYMIYAQPLDFSDTFPIGGAPTPLTGIGATPLSRVSVYPRDYISQPMNPNGIARFDFDLTSFVRRHALVPMAAFNHSVP